MRALVMAAAMTACGGSNYVTVRNDAVLAFPVEDVLPTARVAAAYWGASDAIDGGTIHLVPAIWQCLGDKWCKGELQGDLMTIWVWPVAICAGVTAIPHEAGHAVIGDPGHTDPRWRDRDFWRGMAEALPGDDRCREMLRWCAVSGGCW